MSTKQKTRRLKQLQAKLVAAAEHWQFLAHSPFVDLTRKARRQQAKRYREVLEAIRECGADWREACRFTR